MDYWLTRLMGISPDNQSAQFALQSTGNWMKALSFEIEEEYGKDATDQFQSCRKFFKNKVQHSSSDADKAQVFDSLFSSLTYCLSNVYLSTRLQDKPCIRPISIVNWYYSVYTASRCMLYANGQSVSDTHAAAMKAFASSLSQHLPHPFNMRAERTKGEKYAVRLPQYPNTAPYNLSKGFSESRSDAQGMILQYLSGTAKYWVDDKKEKILSTGKYRDFRTKQAQEERDRRLDKYVGFLHCAFRYRGKANYRDAIYLTYGTRDPAFLNTFSKDLSLVGRFSFLCALAFVERKIGMEEVKNFIEDMERNLRGHQVASTEAKFWKILL